MTHPLPLYDPSPQDRDGWHSVRAPGGYEWWYFDGETAAGDIRFVAILFEGFVFHPQYLRRYRRYRSHPTRHAPPVPSEYPCAYFAVYENGRLVSQFMTQVPPGQFSARSDAPEVAAGLSSLHRDAGGALHLHMSGTPWELTLRGPRRNEGSELLADLTFTPMLQRNNAPTGGDAAAPDVRRFLSRELSGADHQWIIAAPLCRVEGEITLRNRGQIDGALQRVIPVSGRGYHDHNYGAAPIGQGLRRWIWGRMLWDDLMVTFHLAVPTDRRLPDEPHCVEADADGVRDLPITSTSADWSRRTALGLSYPDMLLLHIDRPDPDSQILLTSPQLIDASPFYLRLSYEVEFRGRKITAFCEVAHPHRLNWPILGRMIEMSINRPVQGKYGNRA